VATPFDALNAACVSTFGEPVVYQPLASDPLNPPAPVSISGIVLKESEEEKVLAGRYMRLFVKVADLPTQPQRGDTVTVRGGEYTVFQVFIDAYQGAYLSLRG